MTLQVGLKGSDGLVIASDRLLQQYEHGSRSVGLISKFLNGENVTCCYSGDIVAEYAANNVASLDWRSIPQDRDAIRTHLIAAGSEAWQRVEKWTGTPTNMARKVIAACHNASLWLLEIGPQTIANERLDRCVAGDAENTARYFVNKYGNDCYNRPVKQLITLAAHAILVAGEENPHGVGGLELAVIPTGGPPKFLTSKQERELETRSKDLDHAISGQLFQTFGL